VGQPPSASAQRSFECAIVSSYSILEFTEQLSVMIIDQYTLRVNKNVFIIGGTSIHM